MANITLIRIPNIFAEGALTLSAVPPIALAYLAASLREANHTLKVIDSVGEAIEQVYYSGLKNLHVNGLKFEEILSSIPADSKYIGISFPFSHEWPIGKDLCIEIKTKFPNTILIAGGEHASAMPVFCLKTCQAIDYIVFGEGEDTIVELINTFETDHSLICNVNGIAFRDELGEIVYTQKRKRLIELDKIPRPAWDLIPLETYLAGGYSFGVNIGRTIPLMATRGCPYQCTFCSNPTMWTTRWVTRKPIKVVEEMQEYIEKYNVENFDFYDLTAIVKRDWIIEFCNLLIAKRLNILWQLPSGTRSEALDSEVTKLLYKSGCRNLSYAPESGSPETLKNIKKKINLKKMLASMKSSIKNRINIKVNIIVGFPGERLKNIFQTYKFIIQMAIIGVHDVGVWTFSAYPGSEIFNDLEKKGKLPDFTDEYFISLLSYSDLKNVISWNEYFSNWQLKYIRLTGFLLFYIFTYLVRPFRLITNICNIIQHKPQSRLEMIVETAIYRHEKKVVVENAKS